MADEREALTFVAPDCPCESVVVYLDRAEVKRSLQAKVTVGENEVILKNLSNCIDKDSIRVEGKGPASISEVAFQTKHVAEDKKQESTAKQDELRKQLVSLEKERSVLNAKKHRLQKQRSVLDGFADSVSHPHTASKDDKKPGCPLDQELLQGMTGFFDMYDVTAGRLDDSLHALQQEIEVNQETVWALEKNLNEMCSGRHNKEEREISVLLDATEDAEVTLFVSYVVSNASWSPKYDLRVYAEDHVLKIMYYGMIQQATQENWDNTRLSLSTAMPSVGGTVPDLGTQKLSFKQRTVIYQHAKKSKSMFRSASLRRPQALMRGGAMNAMGMMEESLEDYEEAESAPLTPDMLVPEAKVKESVTSTMFEIARMTSIPCDNVAHKVSVAIIDLKPTFEYETVPRHAAHAYLKARVGNSSPYALLAGPANVFLDNNFIAKASLKAVSPQEDFVCSLGVDPGVRVTYKPVNKFREQSGIITKTRTTTYTQVIDVKNTHQKTIKILVSDQLPLSTEDKIKVNLVEPNLKAAEKGRGPRVNKQNNVEWDVEIGANETKELVLKYTIDHPATEELETNTVHYDTSSPV